MWHCVLLRLRFIKSGNRNWPLDLVHPNPPHCIKKNKDFLIIIMFVSVTENLQELYHWCKKDPTSVKSMSLICRKWWKGRMSLRCSNQMAGLVINVQLSGLAGGSVVVIGAIIYMAVNPLCGALPRHYTLFIGPLDTSYLHPGSCIFLPDRKKRKWCWWKTCVNCDFTSFSSRDEER